MVTSKVAPMIADFALMNVFKPTLKLSYIFFVFNEYAYSIYTHYRYYHSFQNCTTFDKLWNILCTLLVYFLCQINEYFCQKYQLF